MDELKIGRTEGIGVVVGDGPEGPVASGAHPPEAEAAKMDLTGAGRNFLWSTVPSVVMMLGWAFLLSYSIRRIGRVEYGAVVTIGAATSILMLFSGALRYAVVRSGALPGASQTSGVLDDGTHGDAIRAAHALFMSAGAVLIVAGAALGWLIPLDLGLHGAEALQVYVACVILIASAAVLVTVTSFSGVLTSQEQFGTVARIAFLGFVVQGVLTVILVGPFHVIGLAFAGLGGASVQAIAMYRSGRRLAPWLSIRPCRPSRAVVAPIVRYAGGLAILSATSTICTASDAFVIGAVRGGAAVTIFRVGSIVPGSLTGILYASFGALFPRIVRSADPGAQEEGVAWIGRVVGWSTGLAFVCLGLLGPDIVRILLGRPDAPAVHVLWICSAALGIDVSYHGVVQVIFARGQQEFLAKYTWIELVVNLTATVVGVELWGPVGSAFALAATILATDIIGFPLIMRGRWGSPAGRFVWKNGILPSLGAGAIAIGLGVVPILRSDGLVVHGVIVLVDLTVCLAVGLALLGGPGRTRLFSLIRRSRPIEEIPQCA